MPRDSNGVYTLPAGNPVIPGTIIASGWANPTMGDIGNELTDSLSRSGEGGMLAPLRLVDGTIGVPGLSWVSEITSGFYRADTQDVRLAMGGVDVAAFKKSMDGAFIPGISTGVLRAYRGFDPVPGGDSHSFQAGATDGANLRIGPNAIMTLNNGVATWLNVNNLQDSITRIGWIGHTYFYVGETLEGYDHGDQVFQSVAAAVGGLWVNNQDTGLGLERVLTTSDQLSSGILPGPNPTLANAIAALIIGTSTPSTDPHIAAGPTLIQAKANGTTAANLALQTLGGNTTIGAGGLPYMDISSGLLALKSATTSPAQNVIYFQTGAGGAGTVAALGFLSGLNPNALTLSTFVTAEMIRLRVVSSSVINGGANIEPNMATTNVGGISIPGIRTPLIRIGDTAYPDQPASNSSTNHPLQVGPTGQNNLRLSAQAICTNVTGSGGLLAVQNTPNGVATVGDTSVTGCSFVANGTSSAQIAHKNNVVLQSALPAAGGILVNGLYGLQRVLTLGDLPGAALSRFLFLTTVNNTTTPTIIAFIPVLASKNYAVDALFIVTMATTGVDVIFTMQTSVLGFDAVYGEWSVTPFRSNSVYTAVQANAASSSGLDLTLNCSSNPTSNTYWVRFKGTVRMAGSNRDFVPEFSTPVANPNIFEIAQGSYVELTELG